jgi:hypothetical protein
MVDGGCGMADVQWRMWDGGCAMADVGWRMCDGGCGMADVGWRISEVGSDFLNRRFKSEGCSCINPEKK